MARMILEAVGEAHRKRITHRDLKPDNVMVETQDGKDFVKVLDFGLAKMASGDADAAPSLVSGEAILGTPAYMSPEQACGEEVDHRADIYSVGIILYQLLTGELPFRATTSRQMILKQVSAQPPALRETKPDLEIPDGLESIVMRALAKEKEDRFQTAEDFHAALEPYSGEKPRSGPILQLGGGAHASAPTIGGGAAGRVEGEHTVGSITEAVESDSLTGHTIDRYKILAPIAEGGMGAVYRAEHQLMHRECAFKVIKGEHAKDSEVISRFQREAQVSARFKHPGAVEVYDFGPMGRHAYFMAMELVRGRPLSDRLDKGGPLALKDTIEIACQALEVLAAAHKAGIVHRDLKPDNIMLQEVEDWPNQVKLLDFGIAKLSGTKGEAAKFQTLAGAFFGTPQYSSPEQCKGESVDLRSDIYSMGTIIYEMLTGKLPFESETAGGYLVQHMVSPPRPMKQANPAVDVPPEVEQVIMKALAKTREERWQTAEEFEEALKQAAGMFPVFEVGEQGVRLGTAQTVRVGASKKVVAVVVAIAAAVVGTAVFFATRTDKSHAGIQITTTPGDVEVGIFPAAGGEPRTERTNEQGELELKGLLPGDYTLVLAKPGFERNEQHLTLEGGTSVQLPVVLQPSREEAKRDAQTARVAAQAAQADAKKAGADGLAPGSWSEAAKALADAEQALAKGDWEVSKERFDVAKRTFDRAKDEAARAAEENAAIEKLAREVDEKQAAAGKALAPEYAAATYKRAEEEEQRGRDLLGTDRQQARLKLVSARNLYDASIEQASREQTRLLGEARGEYETARGAADEVRAKELASDLYGQAEQARGEAEKRAAEGDRKAAIAALRRAAQILGEARSAAEDRQSAERFAKRVASLLEDARTEARKTQAAQASADAIESARLAPDLYAEARRKDEAAARAESSAREKLAVGAEKVAPSSRAEIEADLKLAIERRRDAVLGYKEAEGAAQRERERQRILAVMNQQRASAAAAKAAYDQQLIEAMAKSADVTEAKKKAIEADAALAAAEQAAALALAPGATLDAIQRATDAATAAANLWQEAKAIAQASVSAGGANVGGPKAAAERLVANYKKAVEAKDLAALKRCYIDISSAERGWKKSFDNPSLSFQVTIESIGILSNDEAEAIVTIVATEGGRQGKPFRARLGLGRAGGAWKIAEVGAAK
jgi:serine/threonine protein kinase